MGYHKEYVLIKDKDGSKICGHVLLEKSNFMSFSARFDEKFSGAIVHVFLFEKEIFCREFFDGVIAGRLPDDISFSDLGFVFCLSDKFLIAGNVKSEILERLIKTHNKFKNQGVCCQIVCKMMRETRLSFFEAIKRPFFEIFNEAEYCETLSRFVPNSDWRSFECFGDVYALGQLFDNHGGLFAFGVAHCSNEASKRPEEFEIEFFDCISGEKLKSVGIIGHL